MKDPQRRFKGLVHNDRSTMWIFQNDNSADINSDAALGPNCRSCARYLLSCARYLLGTKYIWYITDFCNLVRLLLSLVLKEKICNLCGTMSLRNTTGKLCYQRHSCVSYVYRYVQKSTGSIVEHGPRFQKI